MDVILVFLFVWFAAGVHGAGMLFAFIQAGNGPELRPEDRELTEEQLRNVDVWVCRVFIIGGLITLILASLKCRGYGWSWPK